MTPADPNDFADLEDALGQIDKLASTRGRDAEIIALCDQLEQLFPSSFELPFQKAHAQFILGNVDAALEAMSRAAKLAATEPAVHYFLGLWSLDAGHWAIARDSLALAISQELSLGTTYYVESARLARAVALLHLRDFQAVHEQVRSLDPQFRVFAGGHLWSVEEVRRMAAPSPP